LNTSIEIYKLQIDLFQFEVKYAVPYTENKEFWKENQELKEKIAKLPKTS
jgi:hypothetical protein